MANSWLALTLDTGRKEERTAELVRDLISDLRKQGDVEVRESTVATRPGERAVDVGVAGQVVLTFLTAGAAKALISCLKAYIEREPALRFSLKRPDGSEIQFDAKGLQGSMVNETLQAVERLAGDRP